MPARVKRLSNLFVFCAEDARCRCIRPLRFISPSPKENGEVICRLSLSNGESPTMGGNSIGERVGSQLRMLAPRNHADAQVQYEDHSEQDQNAAEGEISHLGIRAVSEVKVDL